MKKALNYFKTIIRNEGERKGSKEENENEFSFSDERVFISTEWQLYGEDAIYLYNSESSPVVEILQLFRQKRNVIKQ